MMTAMRANQYLNTQVRSSTPLELVVLLYDAALRHAVTARDAMARRDIPSRRAAMSKLMAVVGELQHTLDMDRGGDIARQLDELYSWALTQLLDATVHQDPQRIEEVHRVLTILRDGWASIAANAASPMAVGARP
jgi:flagellar protein FliS